MSDSTALTRAVETIDRIDWSPFTLDASGHVERAPDRIEYDAPSVYHDPDDDVTIDGRGAWEAMTGLTGQYGYRGAVMHPSETMAPGVVAAMLDAQGDESWIWALVIVDVLDCDEDCDPAGEDCPGDHEPAGWAIVHRPA